MHGSDGVRGFFWMFGLLICLLRVFRISPSALWHPCSKVSPYPTATLGPRSSSPTERPRSPPFFPRVRRHVVITTRASSDEIAAYAVGCTDNMCHGSHMLKNDEVRGGLETEPAQVWDEAHDVCSHIVRCLVELTLIHVAPVHS